VAGLPPELIGRVGAVLGLVLYALDRSHRRIVFDNLGFAYPHWTRARIRRTARDVYRNLGTTLVEIVQLSCWTPEDLGKHVHVEGLAHLEKAVEQGRGIVVVSAHIGNWEVALAYAGGFLRLPLTAIVKRMRFGPLDRWLNRQRRRFGTTIRYKQRALPQMMAVIRSREALTVLIDQSKRSEGVPVSFFGAQATATTVAALLARRYRSPILPVFCVRSPKGRLTIKIGAAVELVRSKDLRADLQRNTQRLTDVVEEVVRAYPQQWFWFHKRWKHAHPQLYPEYHRRRAERLACGNAKSGEHRS
jgi:KDO2-lipid IV(A) lauroyltransferase